MIAKATTQPVIFVLIGSFVSITRDAFAFNPTRSYNIAAVKRSLNEPYHSNNGPKWMGTENDVELEGASQPDLGPRAFEKEILQQQDDFQSLMRQSSDAKSSKVPTADTNTERNKEHNLAKTGYCFISRGEWREHSESHRLREFDDDNLCFHEPPPNFATLASKQFGRNLNTMLGKYGEDRADDDADNALQRKLAELTITADVAADLEDISGVKKEALILRAPYRMVCPLFELGAFIPHRFYILESVGRAPYLSCLSMLNIYEACGLWRPTEEIRVAHVLQELSKFNRIRIMEELGGDQTWAIRAVASHAALFVQLTCATMWLISPSLSYRFAFVLESYAFHTYDVFLQENKEALEGMPAPPAATKTFIREEELNSSEVPTTLYEVFNSIRSDSAYHAMTLRGSYDPQVALHAPSIEQKLFAGAALALFTVSASHFF